MAAALDGVIIAERYEIQQRIAAGGMAAVYRGWDRCENRPVAIKALRDLDALPPKDVDRFRREGRIARELNCPQIVEVYDFVEDEDGCYLVMELVGGINLKERVQRDGPVPPVEAFEIAARVCRALACAHEHGFIHRDVKPQNILLATTGEVKLTDFGIVHISEVTDYTTSGIVLGTADYISPEQAQGFTLTPATDLYSLGVVIFEMLTGSLPFQGSGVVAVAMQHTTKSPPPLRMLNPALPHHIERLVRRALAKKPEQRFRSAGEMERALLREAASLRQRAAAPRGAPRDGEATQLLRGRFSMRRVLLAASKDDLAEVKTVPLPPTPAQSAWDASSPNGRFGPPDDPGQPDASWRGDASVPPDIVDAYLYTDADITFNGPRSAFVLNRRTALVLLAAAAILLVLLLPKLF